MKKLKRIKTLPLIDLHKLNLRISDTTRFDMTNLDYEKSQELLINIFNTIGNTPGVIIATGMNQSTYVSTHIRGARDKSKSFTFPEPNPVCIYYTSANIHLQKSYEMRNLFSSKKHHFDSEKHYYDFIEYFRETSEGVILLIATIEAFINQLIPEDVIINIDGTMRNKEGIEWLDPKRKIREIIPVLRGIDFYSSNKVNYSHISHTIDLRNDLIHLRKT